MEQRIGFIGLGNMGNAILQGILASNIVSGTQMYVYDPHPDKGQMLNQNYAINNLDSAREVARASDIVFVAVKPNVIVDVLSDIQKELKKNTIVISIAAGVTIKAIAKCVGYEQKIVRVMPNTPALVNAAMCSITPNTEVTNEELSIVQKLLNCIGETEIVPEYLIDAVIGASGSSPAFVFMFIEALADGAVKGGLSRKQAYKFAAQAVLGSAKLLLETGKHPGELKDMVCSPAGTTIEGVHALEEKGFRAAIIDAVEATIKKSKQMAEG
ncbi:MULTISPECIES: pyrroline-5-carboxylate reductase [unclassified Gilliamella]|uniref:pyrroline-5-carboxylate reductase n=1 Tax=unclassified Gilliamella TaxID=2685620 RepID=UPI0013077AAE|nr:MULTISPECIES: pyrroline-5-carboxylate reductase [unclassified Gilliamella]MWP49995.1 pyrroline-5-carboxylate reductase [Gilliamella sp. Lep-s35]MWP69714.1 pyrroline-5-carboxylate reductase [Gilliamella sp. Lep-s5]MWP78025.1 pyrroline-5-carboxylate reductase [Gilliamella sp. Lep-s21]